MGSKLLGRSLYLLNKRHKFSLVVVLHCLYYYTDKTRTEFLHIVGDENVRPLPVDGTF